MEAVEKRISEPSPVHPADSHAQDHSHSAHHLKYGHIDHTDFDSSAAQPAIDKHSRLEQRDAHARRVQRERRYLFRRPRPLQYFRDGVLVRDNAERTSGRLELFFDLTFVGLISVLAKECVEHPNGAHLVKYLLTYSPAWVVWTYTRELFNSFWNDDIQQRALVLYIMIMLVVFGNNAPSVEQDLSEGPARAVAVGSYLLATGGIFATFIFYSFFVKAWRTQIRAHAIAWAVSCGLWISSIFASVRVAVALGTIALFVEYGMWCYAYSSSFKRLMKLRYSSAVSIEHEVERFNDFFTLVMGEFLYSVFSRQPAGVGVHSAAGRAALSVVIAFCFQLFYVIGAGSRRITHAIRRDARCAVSWFSAHFPIVSSLTITGDATAELVKEAKEVPNGVRWIFCGGYAIGMIGLTVLASLDREMDSKGKLWMPKAARLAPRVMCATIVALLPLASPESLDSTGLLGITAALSLATLLWEIVSSLDGPNSDAYSRSVADPLSTIPEFEKQSQMTPHYAQEWPGFPRLAEPRMYVRDDTHQRAHTDEEKAAISG